MTHARNAQDCGGVPPVCVRIEILGQVSKHTFRAEVKREVKRAGGGTDSVKSSSRVVDPASCELILCKNCHPQQKEAGSKEIERRRKDVNSLQSAI
jgi:hypothetical protein